MWINKKTNGLSQTWGLACGNRAGEEGVDLKQRRTEDVLHQWICKRRESGGVESSSITDYSGLGL